jgi:hypothetical protein
MKVHNLNPWKTVGETVLFLVTAVRTSVNPHKSLSYDNVAHQKPAKAEDFRFQTIFLICTTQAVELRHRR